MRNTTEIKLLALGFPSDLIQKISSRSLTISGLKGQNKNALIKNSFTKEEANLILSKVNRSAISTDVIKKILHKTGRACCLCCNGNSAQPYQIHHIEEYHVNQNNEESNLLLVCPTHHVVIHKSKMSIEEQKIKKVAWETLWNVSLTYASRGHSFPFGAFEMQEYICQSNIEHIFSFRPPNGQTCVALSQGMTADSAINILNDKNRLLLTGPSGCGKTTFALGIAGRMLEYSVYKYVSAGKHSIEAAQEIFLFLSLNVEKIILIVDDANAKLLPEQIEKILSIGSLDKKILVVNTRNSFINSDLIEQHFADSVVYIDWVSHLETVKQSLLSYEEHIIEYLNREQLNDFDGYKIGYAAFEYRLESIINKFRSNTNTVWELIYIIGGGLAQIQTKYNELRSNNDFDIIVLYLCVIQIAKVEEGIDVTDIMDLYRRNSILNRSSPPSIDWLSNKMVELTRTRIIKEERGRYKTIHRQYARQFIDMAFSKSPQRCEEVLTEVFSNVNCAKEIVILWSWLRATTANTFIIKWYKSLHKAQWKMLGDNASHNGLSILALLGDHMQYISNGNSNPYINEVFDDKAQVISDYINNGKDESVLYDLRSLSRILKYNSSNTFLSTLELIDKSKFATLVRNSDPESFDDLSWLYCSIRDTNVDWLLSVGVKLNFEDFKVIAEKCKPGRIDTLYEIISFQRNYCMNITRSQFRFYVTKIGELLCDCDLSNIRFPKMFMLGMTELLFYDVDMNDILNKINPEKLAKQYSLSKPREWGKLLSLSMLSEYSSNKNIKRFVNLIDENELAENVGKYSLSYKDEFRLLILQMTYGGSSRKRKISLALRPHVENYFLNQPNVKYADEILNAYGVLDKSSAQEIASRFGRTLSLDKQRRKSKKFASKAIDIAEASGQDYEMEDFMVKKRSYS